MASPPLGAFPASVIVPVVDALCVTMFGFTVRDTSAGPGELAGVPVRLMIVRVRRRRIAEGEHAGRRTGIGRVVLQAEQYQLDNAAWSTFTAKSALR